MMKAMLPLNISDTKVCDRKDLSPGQLFFHAVNGVFVLAIAIEADERHSPWLDLSGDSVFQLDSSMASHRKTVFALGVDPKRIRLRIAHGAAPVRYSEHTLGQLIFDSEDGPCIATGWPERENANYQNTVPLSSWRVSQVNDRRAGVIDDWALSFVDEAGEWVDLVTRNKPA
jgi:hypothetical protein